MSWHSIQIKGTRIIIKSIHRSLSEGELHHEIVRMCTTTLHADRDSVWYRRLMHLNEKTEIFFLIKGYNFASHTFFVVVVVFWPCHMSRGTLFPQPEIKTVPMES